MYFGCATPRALQCRTRGRKSLGSSMSGWLQESALPGRLPKHPGLPLRRHRLLVILFVLIVFSIADLLRPIGAFTVRVWGDCYMYKKVIGSSAVPMLSVPSDMN